MILSARVSRYRSPLGDSVRTAGATWSERSGALLTLEDGQGAFGQGEAAPLPNYSDDALCDAEGQLTLLDLDWLSSALTRAEESPGALFELLAERPLRGVPSAQFALETAALELLARRRREPVHRLIRRTFLKSAATPCALPLTALLSLDHALEGGVRAQREGFSHFKLKVGLSGYEHDELELVGALRARLGASVTLRLDANGAWSSPVASERLAALAPHDIEFIEEPCAAGEPPLLAPALPVALDESLRRSALPARAEAQARRLIALVLKPSVLGGFARSFALIQRGLAIQCESVLSHCFEGPVGFAALCEFALALGSARFAPGLGPHAGLEAWPARPAALERARLVPHERPGLGLGSAPLEPAGSP